MMELALRPSPAEKDGPDGLGPGLVPMGSTTPRLDGVKSVPLPERMAENMLPRSALRCSHAGLSKYQLDMSARALTYVTTAPVTLPANTALIRPGRIPAHMARDLQTSQRPACFPRDLEVWRSVTRRAWIAKTKLSPLSLSVMERQLTGRAV